MSEAAEEYVIEVEAGLGDPPYIVFAKGTVLNPMSVGRRGMWRVDADDVLDVHAYVYYDGRILFLQSADEEVPLVVGGRPVPRSWTATAIPCEVAMGRARLHVREQYTELDSLSDQETVAAHKPPLQRPFPPGAFSSRRSRDSESTRQHPLDMTAAVGIGRPPPPPPPSDDYVPVSTRSPPSADDPTRFGTPIFPAGLTPIAGGENAGETVVMTRAPVRQMYQGGSPTIARPMTPGGMLQHAPTQPVMAPIPPPQPPPPQQHPMHGTVPDQRTAPLGAPVGAPPNPAKMNLKEQWEALSWPKKVAMVMLPLLLLYFLFAPDPDDDRPAPKTAKKPTADAAVVATAPGSQPSSVQTAVPTLPVSALPTAGSAPSPPVPAPSAPPSQRTLERQAVDLVASGQYERAAFVYDQLARQYPDRPVYRETARILRAKLDGGAP